MLLYKLRGVYMSIISHFSAKIRIKNYSACLVKNCPPIIIVKEYSRTIQLLVNGNGSMNREQFVKRTCNVQIAQNGKKWQKPLESGFNH
jgi:hypothetical protein